MTDTFGLETVSALLARAETAGAGAGAAQCVVCGAAAASRCRIYSLISIIISTVISTAGAAGASGRSTAGRSVSKPTGRHTSQSAPSGEQGTLFVLRKHVCKL